MNLLQRGHRFLIESVVALCSAIMVIVMLMVATPLLMLGVIGVGSLLVMGLMFVADHFIGRPFNIVAWIFVKTIVLLVALTTIMFYREMQPSRSYP